MYWNPMSSWPDWLTTSLMIVSWGLALCLVVFALREAFRTSASDDPIPLLETPQDHKSTRAAAERVASNAVAHDG
jgi:hypothetical protein